MQARARKVKLTTRSWLLAFGVSSAFLFILNSRSVQQASHHANSNSHKQILPTKPCDKIFITGPDKRLGTSLLRHHDVILCVALSPNGKLVASSGGELQENSIQSIRLWNVATGQLLREFVGHKGVPGNIVFSPNGNLLASVAGPFLTGNDDTVRVWNVATGKLVHLFNAHQKPRSDTGMVRYGLAFSPDSRILASSGQDGKVRLWDMAKGKEIRTWSCSNFVTALQFSPDGTILAGGSGGQVFVWSATDGKQLQVVKAGRNWLYQLCFASEGKQLIAPTGTHKVCWWNWRTGKKIRQLRGELVGVGLTSKQVAILNNETVSIRDANTGKEAHRFATRGHFGWHDIHSYYSGHLTANGKTLVAASGNSIQVMNTQTGESQHSNVGHWGKVVFVAFTGKNQVVSVGDSSIRLWDLRTQKETAVLKGHKKQICSAAYCPTRNMLVTGSWDGNVLVWDVQHRRIQNRLTIEANTSPLVALTSDGGLLAVKTRYGIRRANLQLWDTKMGKLLLRFGTGNVGDSLTFLPGQERLLDFSGRIHVFSPRRGKRIGSFDNMALQQQTNLAVSPDSRIVALGYADSNSLQNVKPQLVSLWEMASRTMIDKWPGHESGISCLAFSANGSLLATGAASGIVRVWEIATGRQLAKYVGHRGRVLTLAFSTDSRSLISGGTDTAVLLWDLTPLVIHNRKSTKPLTKKRFRALWTGLLANDAKIGYKALRSLVAAGNKGVALLEAAFFPIHSSQTQIAKWLKDLDNDSFATREHATRELLSLGAVVEPMLDAVLKRNISEEVRHRVNRILRSIRQKKGNLTASELRWQRAVAVLELVKTKEAKDLLERLMGRNVPAYLRRQAQMAIQRIQRTTTQISS